MMKHYTFVYDVIAETEKAFAFDYCKSVKNRIPVWFPKSQCGITEPNDVGNRYVHIPAWLACKDGKDYRSYDARFIGVIDL